MTEQQLNYERLPDHLRSVAHALALLWTWRARSHVHDLLRHLGWCNGSRAFSQDDVRHALAQLKDAGLAEEHAARAGLWTLTEPFRSRMYAELLERHPVGSLRAGLHRSLGFDAHRVAHWWPLYEQAPTIAIFRLGLFSPEDAPRLARWREGIARRIDWPAVFREACLGGTFDAGLMARVDAVWRWETTYEAARSVALDWLPDYLPWVRWAQAETLAHPADKPIHLRLQLAELALHGNRHEELERLIADIPGGASAALRAATLIQQGRWAEGQSAFESALKRRQVEVRAKKRVFPESLTWYYPLALLAQGGPKQLELARKFCVGESGSRTPPAGAGWGLWAHACAARLGDDALDRRAFDLSVRSSSRPNLDTLWALLLRAWLAAELPLPAAGRARMLHDEAVTLLKRRLHKVELFWLEEQASAADRVLRGMAVETPFFAGSGQEAWRNVLDALRALASEGAMAADCSGQTGEQRLIWEIVPGKGGWLEDIVPHEQKYGARGWSKPKPVSLGKLAGNQTLAPHDAKVARAIRQDRRRAKSFHLELSAAIMALIGHPHVVLAGAPEVFVDVIEGMPQIETQQIADKAGERIVLRIHPAPHPAPAEQDEWRHLLDEAERRDLEALRYIHLQQESAQRLKVIRLTPTQRRVAQLVAGKFAVPITARGELQGALRALAGHFDVHSDEAAAAREVAAISRLRAELAPAGEGLRLRLVVAPLGPLGPRLMPGRGRRRVMAAVGGESIGTERDLAAEQAHLDAVLARLEFLDPPLPADTLCEWTVEDAELALAMVEALPQLPAIEALDWPRGKPVRVASLDLKQLKITVTSERDWFRVEGRAALDEGRIFELQQLLAAAADKTRFIALGEGQYLALSKSLREKLQALAVIAETDPSGAIRAPALAAPWLADTLDALPAEFDANFAARIARLRQAQEAQPALPDGLQVRLRPYQEDGFTWAMRLAEAGFGACLADDMGLGKTLQALAVLLARAAGGPALVVAPTSVCSNWRAEAARFAPTLKVHSYGEDGRAELIDAAGPGDLIIVSYTLMQQAGEEFAARSWHTLIADEAQAIKNASAKRSQALFDIPADFRLALSGTPVENRLSELWSVMRFCNPGLLGTQSRFAERFANPIERGRDREAQRLLRRLTAPFILRRTKAQVLDDLPPRTELVLSVAPDADEAAHYEALRRNLIAEAESLDANAGQTKLHILAQLTKLRRAACDPRLVTPELGCVGAKVRAFAELAEELAANGHKALVFSQFVDFLALLRAPLDEAGIPYQYLDGSTPPAERTRRVAAFQSGEGDLFLISLKAGGFGLNLTAADYVVITDPWWNPAAEDQAMGRAHRIGQQRPVTVYRLVSKGTLEERIIELHHDKRALAESVLAEGSEAAALPSTEELIALLRA